MRGTAWSAAALAVVAMAGCGSSDDKSKQAQSIQPTKPVTQRTASPAALHTTQTISASYSTGNGPTRATKLAATPVQVDLHAPKPGKYATLGVDRKQGATWARVKVRLKSLGRDPVEQSIASYLLVDGAGHRFSAVPLQVYKPAVSCCGSGYEGDTMAPGDVAEGYVAFQLPQGAEPVKLRMTSDLSNDPNGVEWAIK